MQLEVSGSGLVEQRGSDIGVVWLRGDHDASTVDELTKTFAAALRGGHAEVLVDLSGVTFMDASTVGVIAHYRTDLMRDGRSLKVRDPSASARRVLQLCGLQALCDPPESVA